MKNKAGFTLLETIISCGIFSLILGGIFAICNISDKVYRQENGLLDKVQNVRAIMENISREIRQAKVDDLNLGTEKSNITIEIPILVQNEDGTYKYVPCSVTYNLDGANITRNNRVIARNIQDLTFSKQTSSSLIKISLTSVESYLAKPFTLVSEVKLRNF